LYVEDHCEAIWKVSQQGQLGETYNIGGNNQPANLTIVHSICAILDELQPMPDGQSYESLIIYVKDRPGHDRRYAMDIGKIAADLGWQPRESLQTGLLKTVQWYLSNPEWVEQIRTKKEYSGWLERNYARRGGI
jgi:dTDP-glucose 4,6-dehydratase